MGPKTSGLKKLEPIKLGPKKLGPKSSISKKLAPKKLELELKRKSGVSSHLKNIFLMKKETVATISEKKTG